MPWGLCTGRAAGRGPRRGERGEGQSCVSRVSVQGARGPSLAATRRERAAGGWRNSIIDLHQPPRSRSGALSMRQTIFSIALAFWAGSAAAQTAAPQHPDLTGRWSYNVQQSDDPRDILGRDSTGGARGAGEYRGRRRAGRGGVRGGRG